MSLKVIYKNEVGDFEQLREDAKGFVYSQFEHMCDERDILLEDVNDLIDEMRFVKHSYFTNKESEMIEDYEEANRGRRLCWLEDVCFYPAEGSEYSDPTESGEDELEFDLWKCFIFEGCTYIDAGISELEEIEYNKIIDDKKGCVRGTRIWTGGKMPTVEQRKAKKWKGLSMRLLPYEMTL